MSPLTHSNRYHAGYRSPPGRLDNLKKSCNCFHDGTRSKAVLAETVCLYVLVQERNGFWPFHKGLILFGMHQVFDLSNLTARGEKGEDPPGSLTHQHTVEES